MDSERGSLSLITRHIAASYISMSLFAAAVLIHDGKVEVNCASVAAWIFAPLFIPFFWVLVAYIVRERLQFGHPSQALLWAGWYGAYVGAFITCNWIAIQSARWRAPKKGFCPNCGYDLRATPDACPECGAVIRVRATSR